MKIDIYGYDPNDHEGLCVLLKQHPQHAKEIDRTIRDLRQDPPRLPLYSAKEIGDWIYLLEGAFKRAFLPAKARRLIEQSPLLLQLRTLQRRAQDREQNWPICRRCGCTEHSACPGGCYWVKADLCSACRLIEIEDERSRLEQEKFEIEHRWAGLPGTEQELKRVSWLNAQIARLANEATIIRAHGGRYTKGAGDSPFCPGGQNRGTPGAGDE